MTNIVDRIPFWLLPVIAITLIGTFVFALIRYKLAKEQQNAIIMLMVAFVCVVLAEFFERFIWGSKLTLIFYCCFAAILIITVVYSMIHSHKK